MVSARLGRRGLSEGFQHVFVEKRMLSQPECERRVTDCTGVQKPRNPAPAAHPTPTGPVSSGAHVKLAQSHDIAYSCVWVRIYWGPGGVRLSFGHRWIPFGVRPGGHSLTQFFCDRRYILFGRGSQFSGLLHAARGFFRAAAFCFGLLDAGPRWVRCRKNPLSPFFRAQGPIAGRLASACFLVLYGFGRAMGFSSFWVLSRACFLWLFGAHTEASARVV